jgi:glycosyltransferase involved in cell wall biosynthesis
MNQGATVLKIALVAWNAGHVASAESEPGVMNRGVFGLAQALARQGHEVTVYARRDSARQPARRRLASGVVIRNLAAGPAGRLPASELSQHVGQFADNLAASWRRDRPDVAHAYYWTGGLAALAVSRRQGVPVIETFFSLGAAEHRHQLPDRGPAGRIRLEASIARTVAVVLSSSSEETAELASLGVPRAAVRMVPCGVDTDLFTPDGPAAPRGKRPRLISFGPLTQRQGLDTVIRALAQVPEAELVILGGPRRRELPGDAQYRMLAGLASSVGARDRVTFAGGVRPDEVPAWLRSAAVLVSAASYEPFGMATIQAMACGVPVVASSVGTNQDAVIDGTTGALFSPAQPQLLARKIRELLAAPVRLGAFGEAAADRARSRYSWDRISQETLAAYQRSAQISAA